MQNSSFRIIRTKSIGQIAADALSRPQRAIAFGSTSRGIFVKTSAKWMIFISNEAFIDPLTLTLSESPAELAEISKGDCVQIAPGQIIFPNIKLIIDTRSAAIWQPVPISKSPLPVTERQNQLASFVTQVLSTRQGSVYSQLLTAFLEMQDTSSGCPSDISKLQA